MAGRSMLLSSSYLLKLGEFIGEEFKYRCNYVSELTIVSITKLTDFGKDDLIVKAKTLYQKLCIAEKEKLLGHYSEQTSNTRKQLQSKHPEEVENLVERISKQILCKNNEIIEFEIRSLLSKKDKKPIVILQPNFMGAGLDVRALWEKIKN
jgi:hypothetical protein